MDNYIVSARKYRPSTFQSVVGQKALTTTLKNAIQSNKLAHAYLFCGPRGVGKTSCARIFAKTINCLNPAADGEACNECESCRAFNEQRSYNIHELDAASNNSVEDIRSLIDQVRIPPPIGKYKVFIIDEVHMLSAAAFNAFLKTLEEPPQHAIFILATTEKQKVLPTIISRCQVYDFSRITVQDMVEHLEYVASQEGVTAEPEALNIIAQKADGGMRDALSIFDQVVSFTKGNITYQAVIDNLNVLDYEYYFRLTDNILNGKIRGALLTLNEILSKGFEGQNIISGLASHFRDLLVCKDESTLILFEVGASIREKYKEMAKRCSDHFLFKALELANTCDLNYRNSHNKRLLLELTLIQMCQLNMPENSDDNKKKELIKPLTTREAPQSQVPQPAQAQPQPAANIKTTPTFTSAVPPQATIISETQPQTRTTLKQSRPHASLSIKGVSNEQTQQEESSGNEPSKREDIVTPFTQDELTNAWNDYISNINEKRAFLKNIMLSCKPELKENYLFDIAVQNPEQQDELSNSCLDILQQLRTHLKNNHVQMRTHLIEKEEGHLPFTASEKYNYLLQINPMLEKLKDEFNLSFDR
jgi:DNA polymerase-3 subunit gamma/tau